MAVEVLGEKVDVDKDLTTTNGTKVFTDITSNEQAASFDVAASGSTYTMTLGIALDNLGCASGAKLQWDWTKK
jgi:hypothetical protein